MYSHKIYVYFHILYIGVNTTLFIENKLNGLKLLLTREFCSFDIQGIHLYILYINCITNMLYIRITYYYS